MVKHITITCHGSKQSSSSTKTKLPANVNVKFYTADGCGLSIIKAEKMWENLCKYGKTSYEKKPKNVIAVDTYKKTFVPGYSCWLDYFAGVYLHTGKN